MSRYFGVTRDRPSSGNPASDSQVVLISSAVPVLLDHFVAAANSRAVRNVPHLHVA
jgi:hypothetical protein